MHGSNDIMLAMYAVKTRLGFQEDPNDRVHRSHYIGNIHVIVYKAPWLLFESDLL